MSLSLPIRALGVLENLVGRRHLWRLGRLIYQYARRDGANIPEVNGEYALHRKLARLACQRNETFRVIDVGANVGYWSSHLLDACRTAGSRRCICGPSSRPKKFAFSSQTTCGLPRPNIT